MGYAEFPHGHYLENDNHELIMLAKKLTNEYGEILENTRVAERSATEAKNMVDSFIGTMEAKINQQVSSAVEQGVNGLRQQYTELNNRFNQLSNDFSMLKHNVAQELTNFRAEIKTEMDGLKYYLNDKLSESNGVTVARLNELETTIAVAMSQIEQKTKLYTDTQISWLDTAFGVVLNEKLDYITELYEEIKNSNVYNNVGWLWDNLCSIGGFSAIEIYEYPDFNVDMWNESGITCEEWFTNGKAKLGYYSPQMVNQLNGRLEPIKDVVNLLIKLLDSQGIIANGYGALTIDEEKKGACLCAVQKHQT